MTSVSDDQEDDPEVEFSPLCEKVVWEDDYLDLRIYRLGGRREGWMLEVINSMMTSTVLDDLFDTDQEAYDAFWRMVRDQGVAAFTGKPVLH